MMGLASQLLLPEGGGDRNDIRLFVDGMEAGIYGQWGTRNNLDTGTSSDFSIGRRWDQWQRFMGLYDIRLYGVALSDFEIKSLYLEGSAGMHDLGEQSYSISVWAKPDALVLKWISFATGWYEDTGVEEMQAVMKQGRVDESQYNDMSVIAQGLPAGFCFPGGLTFRAFDGDFSNTNLNEIDGPGYGFGNIANNQMTRNVDANFSALVAFPTSKLIPLTTICFGSMVERVRVPSWVFATVIFGLERELAEAMLLHPVLLASPWPFWLNYSTLESFGATDGQLQTSMGNEGGFRR